MLNTVVKSKYSFNIKSYPWVTTQIKVYQVDIKHKACIFEKDDFDQFLANPDLTTPYWLVRKLIASTAYYGGL